MIVLSDDQIVAGRAAGTLPARFAVFVRSRGALPTRAAGECVTIERGSQVEVGDVVLLVTRRGATTFRRVLAVGPRGALLRRDVAPFDDGWHSEWIGRLVCDRWLDRLARRAPVAWSSTCAALARGFAAFRASMPRPPKVRARAVVRALGPLDDLAMRKLHGVDIDLSQACDRHFGAFVGAELVASTTLREIDGVAWSVSTLVAPHARGAGIGRALISEAVAFACDREVSCVRARIRARNVPSLRVYRAVGFVPVGWATVDGDPIETSERQEILVERRLKAM